MKAFEMLRAIVGRGVLSIDKNRLFSLAAMAAASEKKWADNFPEDEPYIEKPRDGGTGVRVIPLKGMVSHGEDAFTRWWWGMMETDHVGQWIRNAVADKSVRAIVLDVNSPGGYVTGTPELAEIVRQAAALKPIIAHTSTLMASAAYWIASQASMIYATASATVGSIGVFTTHIDFQDYYDKEGIGIDVFKSGDNKAAGIAGTRLTAEQRQLIQDDVDAIGVEFRSAVLAARKTVPAEAMDGRAVSAKAAVEQKFGLVDSIQSIEVSIADAGRFADLLKGIRGQIR